MEQAIRQAVNSRATFPKQLAAALRAYVNIGLYEPSIVELLLVGGVGAVPALSEKRAAFREQLVQTWQRPLPSSSVFISAVKRTLNLRLSSAN